MLEVFRRFSFVKSATHVRYERDNLFRVECPLLSACIREPNLTVSGQGSDERVVNSLRVSEADRQLPLEEKARQVIVTRRILDEKGSAHHSLHDRTGHHSCLSHDEHGRVPTCQGKKTSKVAVTSLTRLARCWSNPIAGSG